jgi:hypothetical protein
VTFKKGIDEALDKHSGEAGTVSVHGDVGTADVEIVEFGRIGVRVREIRVDRRCEIDVKEEAQRMAERLRSLGEALAPVEVAPTLGGAILRTRPEEMRDREFYEVNVTSAGTSGVRRFRIGEDNGRESVDFDLTRDQLGRILDEL